MAVIKMADRNDIEAAIAIAEVKTGVRGGSSKIPLCIEGNKVRHRIWKLEENKFLEENNGRLSEEEMARRLGRTKTAVHIHREREMHLCSMSKAPDILTAEQIANGFGCDSKTIHLLIDRGLMPGRRLPCTRIIRVVDKLALIKWMLNPDHWIYFKPARVGLMRPRGRRGLGESYDFLFWEEVRELVLKAHGKWSDQWLTPGQVATRLNIEAAGTRYVNVAVAKGILKATRWGNFWIRKSDLPAAGKTINFRGHIVDIKKP